MNLPSSTAAGADYAVPAACAASNHPINPLTFARKRPPEPQTARGGEAANAEQ